MFAPPPSRPLMPSRPLLVLFPARSSEILTLVQLPGESAPAEGGEAAAAAQCPLLQYVHLPQPALPPPRSPHMVAAATVWGSLLVLCSGTASGVVQAVPTKEKAASPGERQPAMWWQWQLVPRSASVLDPTVAARGGLLAGGPDHWTCPCGAKV